MPTLQEDVKLTETVEKRAKDLVAKFPRRSDNTVMCNAQA